MKKAIIIGAGIGGLTSALSLHAAGWTVEVYEAVTELAPLGVGINLLPHGSAVLHRLGLGDRLDDTGIRTRAIEYRTRFGQLIMTDPRGIEAGFDYPQYSIHRGQLQFLLLAAVRERLGHDSVRTGMPIHRYSQDAGQVTAHFAEGRATGSVLIGADGIHSTVRRQLFPADGPPHYEGVMMWRGAHEQAPFGDGRTMMIAGNHDLKVVCYPISEAARRHGRALVNWVAEVRFDTPRPLNPGAWTRQGSREFIDRFAAFRNDVLDFTALFRATETIYEYPMIDRDPLPHWTDGRVTLLGDAAHPMYPIGANGASQAILDAEALAAALQRGDPLAGLAAYEAERRPTTTAVVLENRRYGPEKVLDLADARITGPDDRIEDLIPPEELEAVARDYRAVAGFQRP